MKKLLGIVVLGLSLFFLNSCDDASTKIRKKNCEKFVEKNTTEYKNCYKNYNYYFVYSLEEDLQRIQKEIKLHNQQVDLVNSIGSLVEEEVYEEVDLGFFLNENFSDTLFLTIKNDDILNKKIRFKSQFYLGLGENDPDAINLTKKDPNDPFNSLWFFDAYFYNVKVKEKLIYPGNQRIFWMGTTGEVDSEVFGVFYSSPGSYGSETKFFIQDIKLDKKNYEREEMINYLVEQHSHSLGRTNDPDKPTVDEVRLEVKSLIQLLLK
jgi:hypothetical protein